MNEYIGPDAGSMGVKAFKKFLELTPEGEAVLELGSGYSTKLLAEIYNVTTIEHDPKWVGKVEGVTYRHIPLTNNHYDTEMLYNVCKGLTPYAIIIDGPPGYGVLNGSRSPCLGALRDVIDQATVILVDDTHRKDEHDLAMKIARQHGFRPTQFVDGSKSAILLTK